MQGKARILYFVALLGLALAAPSLLRRPEQEEHAAAQDAQGAAEPGAKQSATKDAESDAAVQAGGKKAASRDSEDGVAKLDPKAQAARAAKRRVAVLESDEFTAEVVNLNGGLTTFRLKGNKYRNGDAPIDIVTTNKEAFLPLAIDVEGVPKDTVFDLEQTSPRSVELHYDGDALHVVRKLEAGNDPYQLWITTRLENRGTSALETQLRLTTYHYVTSEALSSGIPLLPVRSPARSNALCHGTEDLARETHDSLEKGTAFGEFRGQDIAGPVAFAGVENVYFLSAIAPSGSAAEACRMGASPRGGSADKPAGYLMEAGVRYPTIKLSPGEDRVYRTLAYLGPKTPEPLARAGHSLKEAIETGWFTALAEGLTWLLRKIHDFVGNWGLAIIVLTLLVKLTLFPLTAKQMQSMARMKELKPELDHINELYADDREKKGAAMMELYRKRGVNPAAGCFPVLLQLPIWFSLYRSLATNVELFHADFALWWTDLSSPDPYFSLPLALGVLMFVQQKITPSTGMDPLQQKMMLYMMPTMITSFMLFLPVGLCLYMFTNSALSIVQQRVIEARLASARAADTKAHQNDSKAADASPNAPDGKAKRSKKPDKPTQTDAVTASTHESTADSGDAAKARPKSSRPSKAERRSRRGK